MQWAEETGHLRFKENGSCYLGNAGSLCVHVFFVYRLVGVSPVFESRVGKQISAVPGLAASHDEDMHVLQCVVLCDSRVEILRLSLLHA